MQLRFRPAARFLVAASLCFASTLAGGAAALADQIVVDQPTSPPPNLFPSWLSAAYSPRYEPVTWQVPWINTPSQQAGAPWSLKSPTDGSFVSCTASGSLDGLPQKLTSSANGRFGSNNLVEPPCAAPAGLFCSNFNAPPTAEEIATAQANAYVSLRAFHSYFASLGWSGIDGLGTPVRVAFGELTSPIEKGWNPSGNATHYCPDMILHIDHHVHEFVHGVVQATADFTYNGSGSGGDWARVFNEAYADFFAEMVEFDAALPDTSTIPGSPGDYLVITGKKDPGISGNFHAPSRPCHDSAPIPGQAGWYTHGGPIRHAMYLLAEGTDPAPPLPHSNVCRGPSVLQGIGRDRTAEIFLDALVNCDWRADGATMNICDIRRCTIASAPCPEHDAVVRAWNAVNVTSSLCGTWDSACQIGQPPASK